MGNTASVFAKAYLIAVGAIFLLSLAVATLASIEPLGLAQSLFVFIGIAYVFASVLAWTGFANAYRFSPTLFLASRSYRGVMVQRRIAEEGREPGALGVGLLFGFSLVGTGLALSGGLFTILVIGVVVGILLCLRSLRQRTVGPIRHP